MNVANTLKSQAGKNGSGIGPEHTFVAFHQTQDPISGTDSPAIGRTSIGMGVSDGAMVRRLTPIECERLQGFPDQWTRVPDSAPDSRRYAALGDAVTVPVAQWIGLRIRSAA